MVCLIIKSRFLIYKTFDLCLQKWWTKEAVFFKNVFLICPQTWWKNILLHVSFDIGAVFFFFVIFSSEG